MNETFLRGCQGFPADPVHVAWERPAGEGWEARVGYSVACEHTTGADWEVADFERSYPQEGQEEGFGELGGVGVLERGMIVSSLWNQKFQVLECLI